MTIETMAEVRYDSAEKIEVLFDRLHQQKPTSQTFRDLLKSINNLKRYLTTDEFETIKFRKYQEHLEKAGQLTMF